jgi:hypothetical protein
MFDVFITGARVFRPSLGRGGARKIRRLLRRLSVGG